MPRGGGCAWCSCQQGSPRCSHGGHESFSFTPQLRSAGQNSVDPLPVPAECLRDSFPPPPHPRHPISPRSPTPTPTRHPRPHPPPRLPPVLPSSCTGAQLTLPPRCLTPLSRILPLPLPSLPWQTRWFCSDPPPRRPPRRYGLGTRGAWGGHRTRVASQESSCLCPAGSRIQVVAPGANADEEARASTALRSDLMALEGHWVLMRRDRGQTGAECEI